MDGIMDVRPALSPPPQRYLYAPKLAVHGFFACGRTGRASLQAIAPRNLHSRPSQAWLTDGLLFHVSALCWATKATLSTGFSAAVRLEFSSPGCYVRR